MNDAITAQHLASKGRGEDKMLVHMTPDEVRGLQAIAMAQGGSLTINPETGLPEAGALSRVFKSLAPTLAGVGLSALFPAAAPWMIGLGVGGFETLRTGDLGRGLMAGLGAYGGAGIGQSLQTMGNKSITNQMQQGLDPSGVDFAPDVGSAVETAPIGADIGGSPGGTGGVFGNISDKYPLPGAQVTPLPSQPKLMNFDYQVASPVSGPSLKLGSPIAQPTSTMVPIENLGGPSGAKPNFSLAENEALGLSYGPEGMGQGIGGGPTTYFERVNTPGSPMYEGAKQVFEPGGYKEFGKTYLDTMGTKGAILSGIPTVVGLGEALSPEQGAFMPPAEASYNYGGPYEPTPRDVRFRGRENILSGSGEEFEYFTPVNPYPSYQSVNAAKGGLLDLNKMAGGRYLQGDGDGTSDSIPAMIGNDQPARLADGEFVIDARTVSELGNGSSDAGARKLYTMMDNVHKARRGAERGKPSGADQYLKGLTATA